MVRSHAKCILCLVAGAAASLSDRVSSVGRPNRTANFGVVDESTRSEHVQGTLVFELGGKPGYQAVQWTTGNITIPAKLIQEVCGSFPDKQSFTYSINEKWAHASHKAAAQGPVDCGVQFTGGHWDPTAACSKDSANPACAQCGTAPDYRCSSSTFKPQPDASGSFAYRFLNEDACELGDLSGMSGELQVVTAGNYCADEVAQCRSWALLNQCEINPEYMLAHCKKSCGLCTDGEGPAHVAIKNLANASAGLAQLSTPFGVISKPSVEGSLIGINCDASGPPPAHGTNCGCLEYNGKRSPSVGSMTVFRPLDHSTFYLGGPRLSELVNRSIVVHCGSSFGDKMGEPLFCAALA